MRTFGGRSLLGVLGADSSISVRSRPAAVFAARGAGDARPDTERLDRGLRLRPDVMPSAVTLACFGTAPESAGTVTEPEAGSAAGPSSGTACWPASSSVSVIDAEGSANAGS